MILAAALPLLATPAVAQEADDSYSTYSTPEPYSPPVQDYSTPYTPGPSYDDSSGGYAFPAPSDGYAPPAPTTDYGTYGGQYLDPGSNTVWQDYNGVQQWNPQTGWPGSPYPPQE
jgi:hypothetical protein